MKLKNNVSLLSAGLTALLLTMGAGQALAEDGKVYPASFCKHDNEVTAGTRFSIFRGEFRNTDVSAVRVECPIIKERINSSLRNGFVRVMDQNSNAGQDVSCTLISRRTHIFPDQSFTITKRVPRPFDTTVQQIDFGSLGHDRKNTTYTLRCDLPGMQNGRASSIMGYYISENT